MCLCSGIMREQTCSLLTHIWEELLALHRIREEIACECLGVQQPYRHSTSQTMNTMDIQVCGDINEQGFGKSNMFCPISMTPLLPGRPSGRCSQIIITRHLALAHSYAAHLPKIIVNKYRNLYPFVVAKLALFLTYSLAERLTSVPEKCFPAAYSGGFSLKTSI